MVRKLGIRHLVVVNIKNEVVGMITRKNLVTLEAEKHPYKQSKLKQKPLFFKAKMNEGELIGIQRYWGKFKNTCGGINVAMDMSGRVRFSGTDNEACVTNEDGLRHRSAAVRSSVSTQSLGYQSILSTQSSDVSYVHIPYESI